MLARRKFFRTTGKIRGRYSTYAIVWMMPPSALIAGLTQNTELSRLVTRRTPRLSAAGPLQDRRHFGIAAAAGMNERRDTVAIRDVDVGAGIHQQPHDVGVNPAA